MDKLNNLLNITKLKANLNHKLNTECESPGEGVLGENLNSSLIGEIFPVKVELEDSEEIADGEFEDVELTPVMTDSILLKTELEDFKISVEDCESQKISGDILLEIKKPLADVDKNTLESGPPSVSENDEEQEKEQHCYKCESCGASFSEICNLRVHELIHADEHPFVCNICGKSYKYAPYLKMHERVHTELGVAESDDDTAPDELYCLTREQRRRWQAAQAAAALRLTSDQRLGPALRPRRDREQRVLRRALHVYLRLGRRLPRGPRAPSPPRVGAPRTPRPARTLTATAVVTAAPTTTSVAAAAGAGAPSRLPSRRDTATSAVKKTVGARSTANSRRHTMLQHS